MVNIKGKPYFALNVNCDIILQLETLGFDSGEFLIAAAYIGDNNQIREQFICTERRCEYFSNRLNL